MRVPFIFTSRIKFQEHPETVCSSYSNPATQKSFGTTRKKSRKWHCWCSLWHLGAREFVHNIRFQRLKNPRVRCSGEEMSVVLSWAPCVQGWIHSWYSNSATKETSRSKFRLDCLIFANIWICSAVIYFPNFIWHKPVTKIPKIPERGRKSASQFVLLCKISHYQCVISGENFNICFKLL